MAGFIHTRGLKRRAKKEEIREEKEASRLAWQMEKAIRNVLPDLDDHHFSFDRESFYTNWLAEPPIASRQALGDTFRHIAKIAKDPEVKKAFTWASEFESNGKAREFVRGLSPAAFDKLTP